MAQAPTKKQAWNEKEKKNPHIQKTLCGFIFGNFFRQPPAYFSIYKSYKCAPCNSYPIDSPVGHRKQDHLGDIILHTAPKHDDGHHEDAWPQPKVTAIRIPQKESVNKTTRLQWPMITWVKRAETLSWGLIPNNSEFCHNALKDLGNASCQSVVPQSDCDSWATNHPSWLPKGHPSC